MNHGSGLHHGRYGSTHTEYRYRSSHFDPRPRSRMHGHSFAQSEDNAPISPVSMPSTIGNYFRNVSKSALTSAVIHGLSATVPPIGAVAIPAYAAYGYLRWGSYLYMAYYEMQLRGTVRPNTAREVVGRTTEI